MKKIDDRYVFLQTNDYRLSVFDIKNPIMLSQDMESLDSTILDIFRVNKTYFSITTEVIYQILIPIDCPVVCSINAHLNGLQFSSTNLKYIQTK